MEITKYKSETAKVYDASNLDEAIAELRNLDERANGILGIVRERGKDLVRTRFLQGQIISQICENAEYGDAIVPRLAHDTGMTETMIRECRRFYEHDRFDGEMGGLESWFADTESRGGSATWSHIRTIIRRDQWSRPDELLPIEPRRKKGPSVKTRLTRSQVARKKLDIILRHVKRGQFLFTAGPLDIFESHLREVRDLLDE